MQTEIVNGREYQVVRHESQPLTKQNLNNNGWDGYSYMLTGKRGATYLAYRHNLTKQLHIATSLGKRA